MGSFDGRVALVTGGASGIGKATAQRLASEGAAVVVADVAERAGTEVAAGIGGTFALTDVTSREQMEAAVAIATGTYGGLDIVHLNAGVATGESDIARLEVDTYRRALGINVDGVVFGAMAAVPVMRRGGAIVATASLAGLVSYPGDPIYALTKHAVVGFVRAMAEQLKERGITINALCPGFADTPILEGYAEGFRAAGFPLLAPEEVAESVIEIITSGRTGEAFVCQPGRLCVPYGFRGVPGPRVAGAEGMAPPAAPGVP